MSSNRSVLKRGSLGVLMGIVCTPTWAQTVTDAQQKIDELLRGLGAVPITRHEQKPYVREICAGRRGTETGDCWMETFYTDRVVHSDEVLKATNLNITSTSPIQFKVPPTRTEVPTRITASGRTYVNCSTTINVNPSTALAVAFQRSSSIQVSHSVTNAGAGQFNWSYKVNDNITLGGNLQLSRSTTDGQVNTSSYQETVTRTDNFALAAPGLAPHKAIALIIQTWPVIYSTTFEMKVTIDGDVSVNDKGYRRLSDVFPVDKRTFVINGSVTFNDAAEGQTTSYDVDYDFSKCPATGGGLVTLPLEETPNTKLNKIER